MLKIDISQKGVCIIAAGSSVVLMAETATAIHELTVRMINEAPDGMDRKLVADMMKVAVNRAVEEAVQETMK